MTLSHMQTIYTIKSDFDDLLNNSVDVKTYTGDLLANSCQMFLDKTELFQRDAIFDIVPTAEAFQLAKTISDYYVDRFNRAVLLGNALTSFRTALYTFLAGRTDLTHQDIGLICRTPYYYEEDRLFEVIITKLETVEIIAAATAKDLRLEYIGGNSHRTTGLKSFASKYNRYYYMSDIGPVFIETSTVLEANLMMQMNGKNLIYSGNLRRRTMNADGATQIAYYQPTGTFDLTVTI